MALLRSRLTSPGIRGGRVAARLLLGAALSFALLPAFASSTENELKAAFIYQIAKFVDWPPARGSMRLCVVGNSPFGAALETIRGKPLNEQKLEVAHLDSGADLRECAVLFIAASAERHLERIVALSRGGGMLTMGDTEGFAQRGVVVNFYLENGKVRFEINLDVARQTGLKISSRLLSLARIVDSPSGASSSSYDKLP